jgi:hypothetical protein
MTTKFKAILASIIITIYGILACYTCYYMGDKIKHIEERRLQPPIRNK